MMGPGSRAYLIATDSYRLLISAVDILFYTLTSDTISCYCMIAKEPIVGHMREGPHISYADSVVGSRFKGSDITRPFIASQPNRTQVLQRARIFSVLNVHQLNRQTFRSLHYPDEIYTCYCSWRDQSAWPGPPSHHKRYKFSFTAEKQP